MIARFEFIGGIALAVVFSSFGLAQMHGGSGMGGGGGMMGDGGTQGGGMMGDAGYMDGGMMGGNMTWSGVPAVGPDGSAYVIRRSAVGSWQTTPKAELLAINPSNGTPRLLATVEGAVISQPVTSRDGRIFMTTSEADMSWYLGGTNGAVPPGTGRKAALVIVTPGTGQVKTVAIDGDILSAPRVADEPNGYVVYVAASQAGPQLMLGASGTFLYGFSGDGTQRFKVQLIQPAGRN